MLRKVVTDENTTITLSAVKQDIAYTAYANIIAVCSDDVSLFRARRGVYTWNSMRDSMYDLEHYNIEDAIDSMFAYISKSKHAYVGIYTIDSFDDVIELFNQIPKKTEETI